MISLVFPRKLMAIGGAREAVTRPGNRTTTNGFTRVNYAFSNRRHRSQFASRHPHSRAAVQAGGQSGAARFAAGAGRGGKQRLAPPRARHFILTLSIRSGRG